MLTAPERSNALLHLNMVQHLVERCLLLYLTQEEAVEALLAQAKIEPFFTELVWRSLELENQAFFQAYRLRLIIKQQIMEFNRLLNQQLLLMHQFHPSIVSSRYNSNGAHLSQMPQMLSCYIPENTGNALKQENLPHSMGFYLPNGFHNSNSSLYNGAHPCLELPTHVSRNDALSAMLSTQNSNLGLMQGTSGIMVKSEAANKGSSAYMFGHTAFNSIEQSRQLPLMDANTSSFGISDQVPQNFSLPDLTADFSHCPDIEETNPRFPLLGINNENFLHSREREQQGNGRRLDTISEESRTYSDYRNQ